jgi:nickel/cobalt transporter (NiCoT) family protein
VSQATLVIARSRSRAYRLSQRNSLVGMIIAVVALHVLGWSMLLLSAAQSHLATGAKGFGVAIGSTAYLLGVRHAFDPDHIAAIDNTTRQLVAQGRRSLSVGFWFSLGHSTIVLALTMLVAFGAYAAANSLLSETSVWRSLTATVGTMISGGYLLLCAGVNLVMLMDLWQSIRRMRRNEKPFDAAHKHNGLALKLLGPLSRAITRPWQMYLVGLLFGLGFDTATEISLLALSGSGAASGLPWYAVLSLPLLFAAGMSLFDGLDGLLMNAVYGWAATRGGSRIRYDAVVTLLSVSAAVGIGSLEIGGLLVDHFHLDNTFLNSLANLDLSNMGIGLTFVLGSIWLIARQLRGPGRLGA